MYGVHTRFLGNNLKEPYQGDRRVRRRSYILYCTSIVAENLDDEAVGRSVGGIERHSGDFFCQ